MLFKWVNEWKPFMLRQGSPAHNRRAQHEQLPLAPTAVFRIYTLNGQVLGFFRKQLELHGHQSLHVSLEAGAEFGDTGINAFLEFFELIVVDAIQYLLFDEPPQAFDQIQVGGAGR
ncbi:MAG: hypothetical protein PHD43_20890 [Methylococcales bacterium]|nr:hypothetical protein [Methylococcales bacterium]